MWDGATAAHLPCRICRITGKSERSAGANRSMRPKSPITRPGPGRHGYGAEPAASPKRHRTEMTRSISHSPKSRSTCARWRLTSRTEDPPGRLATYDSDATWPQQIIDKRLGDRSDELPPPRRVRRRGRLLSRRLPDRRELARGCAAIATTLGANEFAATRYCLVARRRSSAPWHDDAFLHSFEREARERSAALGENGRVNVGHEGDAFELAEG